MNDASLPPAGDPRPAPPRRYRAIQRVEGPVLNALGLSCREFARLTVTRMDRPLTANEALRLRLHGAMCGLCTRFAAQFSAIDQLVDEIETETPATGKLPPEDEMTAIERIKATVRSTIERP